MNSDRLIDRGADDFERVLLASAQADRGSERALKRALVVFGSAGTTAALTTGTAAAALTRTGGRLLLGKWLAIAGAMGVGAAGGLATVVSRGAHEPVAAPATIVTSAPRAAVRIEPDRPVIESVEPIDGAPPSPAVVSRRRTSASSGNNPAAPSTNPSTAVDTPRAPSVAPATNAVASSPPADIAASSRSLAAEIATLDATRAALATGESATALRLLDGYARDFSHPALGQEANLLHLEALLRAGSKDKADALAREILNRHPTGPHAARVRSLLSEWAIP